MASATIGEMRLVFKADTGDAEKSIKKFGDVAKTEIIANVVNKGFNLAVDAAKDFATSMVQVGMNFEKSMSKVAAISGATGADLEALTTKAREMGETTVWSASDAADAMGYMAMAGWDTEQMLSGIAPVMNLATAAGEDLASVSDIVTDALTAFGLSANDASHFADVLAKASSTSNTNVGMMGETFKYVAPIAGALGYSIEDTSVAIGLMANGAVKAGQAGTTLRSMLTRLAAPPKECATAMEDLNISMTNADGTMKPLSKLMVEMRDRFNGLSEAEKIQYAKAIAGQEAMSGLLDIVRASDEDFNKLTTEISNSNGAAKSMADIMGDNLAGNVASLNAKFEALQLDLYNQVAPALNTVVDGLKWAVDNADWLIPVVAGLTAAFVTYEVVTKAAAIAQGLLNAAMSLSPVGLIIAAVVGLVAGLVLLWNNCEGFRNFIMGAVEAIGSAIGAAGEFISGVFNTIGEIATSIFQAIWDFISPIVDLLVQAFQNWWNAVSTIFQAIWDVASTVFGIIWEIVSTVISNIVTIFQNLWQIISTIFGLVWNTVSEVFSNIWNTVSGVIENIKSAFQAAWNFIAGIFGQVGSWFRDRFNEALSAIKNVFSGIADFFGGIWNQIVGVFSTIGTKVGEVVNGAFKGVVNGVLSTVENILNGPIRAINGLIDVINNIPGINLGHLSEFNLPRMATGGIVPGNSYSGDHNMIMANSGEMVITRSQQAALWDMIESGNYNNDAEYGDNYSDNSRSVEIIQHNTIENGFDVEQMNQAMLAAMRGV